MITLTINGLPVSVEDGTTLLEAMRFLGFPVPTLCQMEGLSPYGACRLCVVEIGEGTGAKLVSSCTYPAQEGIKGRTALLGMRCLKTVMFVTSLSEDRTAKSNTEYVVIYDTAPDGLFDNETGRATTNALTVPMPAGTMLLFKAGGVNSCGLGP